MKASFFQRGGTRLYYEVYAADKADTPWVTMLNGHTRSCQDFKRFANQLSTKGISVLLMDHRGAGQTQEEGDFTLTDMAWDVLELWRDLKISRSSLFGISMGGVVIQKILEIQKKELSEDRISIEQVFLVSTTPHHKWLNGQRPFHKNDSLDQLEEKLKNYVSPVFANNHKTLIRAMAKQMHQTLSVSESSSQRWSNQKKALGEFDFLSPQEKYPVPTWIVHGEEDQIINVNAAHELSSNFLSCHIEILSGTGHLILAEKPRVLGALLDKLG